MFTHNIRASLNLNGYLSLSLLQISEHRKTPFDLSQPPYQTRQLTQTVGSHGHSLCSGKAGIFFWDLIALQPFLCPGLAFPLFVFSLRRCSCRSSAEKMADRWWQGQKRSLWGTSSVKQRRHKGRGGLEVTVVTNAVGWIIRLGRSSFRFHFFSVIILFLSDGVAFCFSTGSGWTCSTHGDCFHRSPWFSARLWRAWQLQRD